MALPDAGAARKLPTSLQQNELAEQAKDREGRLRLPGRAAPEPGLHLSLSPITGAAMDAFEEFYLRLRRQDRSLKRYEVMDAVLRALEDEEVQARVVERVAPR